MTKKMQLCLLICSLFATTAVFAQVEQPYRENLIKQPVYEMKLSTPPSINSYYIGKSTVQVCKVNSMMRLRIFLSPKSNTKSIFLSPLTAMTTWQMINASIELLPGDEYRETQYYGPYWALNEDKNQSSSTLKVFDYKIVQ